jgi:ubiquinol-cytochrome c reductase cytochrome b subunit
MVTRRACIALQRRDRRRLRQGTEFGITAVREGSAYAAVARPASGEERAAMEARRPDELFMPIPRHLVPLPTTRRALAQLRVRVNHFYVLSRLETPSAGPPPGTDGQASHAGPHGGASDHASGMDGQVTTRSGRGEKD